MRLILNTYTSALLAADRRLKTLAGGVSASTPSSRRVVLVTMGPGESLVSKLGHAALVVAGGAAIMGANLSFYPPFALAALLLLGAALAGATLYTVLPSKTPHP